MALDADDLRPPYVQIADALRVAIRAGSYAPGERLPTVLDLVAEYGVAKQTVQRALDILRKSGYIASWQGRGTFVRDPLPRDDAPLDTFDAITQRLDAMCDQIRVLTQRVDHLESRRKRRGGK